MRPSSKKKLPPLQRLFDRMVPRAPAYRPAQAADTPRQAAQALALIRAIERGDAPQVRQLLGQGANPAIMAADGRLALNECLHHGQHSLARLLVAAGADPRAMDRHGATAMGLAWAGARGGQALTPSIRPQSSGQDQQLLSEWGARFGRRANHELFSPTHQDFRMGRAMAARLDLDGNQSGGWGHDATTPDTLATQDIASPATLMQRLRERQARMGPRTPDPLLPPTPGLQA